MARLWSSGAELNSTTLEGTTVNSTTVAIETSPVRTDTYSYSTTAATTSPFLIYQITASSTDTGTYFLRAYINITTLPSADRYVLVVVNSGAALGGGLKITTTGAIQLFQGSGGAGTQVGSNGPTLSPGQWYRIELKIQGTNGGTGELRGRLDGTEFAGSASANTQYVQLIRWGQAAGGNTTADFNFDDLAFNDSTGSFQNTYPGVGEIRHLRPSATGDNGDWTGDNTDIDEVTPDDTTTKISDNIINHVEDVNIDDTPAGISSNDTINVVAIGCRFNGAGASLNASFVLRVKASSGGTVEESSALTPSNTTWVTNASAIPFNYSLTLYDLPGASTTAWTKTDLDAAQIGVRLSSVSTNVAQVSTLWLLVDSTPGVVVPPPPAATLAMMGVG